MKLRIYHSGSLFGTTRKRPEELLLVVSVMMSYHDIGKIKRERVRFKSLVKRRKK